MAAIKTNVTTLKPKPRRRRRVIEEDLSSESWSLEDQNNHLQRENDQLRELVVYLSWKRSKAEQRF
jgi:hypothetical protein